MKKLHEWTYGHWTVTGYDALYRGQLACAMTNAGLVIASGDEPIPVRVLTRLIGRWGADQRGVGPLRHPEDR